jgi:hypothetical protein
LLVETLVGLPRSSLVKKPFPAPAGTCAPTVPRPTPTPLEVAATCPAIVPPTETEAKQVVAAVAKPEPPKPVSLDDIDVMVADDMRIPFESIPDAAPSKEALLERAAALGPVRMTWASILPTSDPILEAKQKPVIAERRARLTKVVKGTLGACAALCVLAVVVSIFSAGESSASAATSSAAAAFKTAPAQRVVAVEQLAGARRGKAAVPAAPRVTTAAFVRAKRR